MANEKSKDTLSSFKVGDAYRNPIGPAKKGAKGSKDAGPSQQTQSTSLGFARIEGILENEDPAAVVAGLNALREKLEAQQNQAKSNKGKAEAGKAIIAIQHTLHLLEYLFYTKEQMVQQLMQQSATKRK